MRFLIVTALPLFGHHLSALFRGNGHVGDVQVSSLQPAPAVRQYLQDYAVDAVVLDLRSLSRMQGCARLGIWRRVCGKRTALMVVGDREDIPALLTRGADGAHEAEEDARVLKARVYAMVRRRQGFSSEVLCTGPLQLDLHQRRLTVHGHPVRLTRFELRVLEVLMRNRERLICRPALILHLMPEIPPGERMHSLDVIVGRLRQKFRPYTGDTDACIRTVRGEGYVFSPGHTVPVRTPRERPCRVHRQRAGAAGWRWSA